MLHRISSQLGGEHAVLRQPVEDSREVHREPFIWPAAQQNDKINATDAAASTTYLNLLGTVSSLSTLLGALRTISTATSG